MTTVITTPVTFETSDLFDPSDLNRSWTYAADCVADVASKRFHKAVLTIPFRADIAVAYTETYGEMLTQRITSPATCIIERATLNAHMSSSADVVVTITKTSDGSTPLGATVPYLDTDGAVASSATEVESGNFDRVLLEKDAQYKIVVSGAGTFTLNRFDVTLHLLVDRWCLAGTTSVPSYDPTLVTDGSFANATTITTNNTALATEAAKFATSLAAPAPSLLVAHSFTSATSADLLTFPIPRFASARARASIKRIYTTAIMSGSGGGTVTAQLKDNTGAVVTTVAMNVSGVTYADGDSGAVDIAIDGGSSTSLSSDYSLVLSASTAIVTCERATVLLWIARD